MQMWTQATASLIYVLLKRTAWDAIVCIFCCPIKESNCSSIPESPTANSVHTTRRTVSSTSRCNMGSQSILVLSFIARMLSLTCSIFCWRLSSGSSISCLYKLSLTSMCDYPLSQLLCSFPCTTCISSVIIVWIPDIGDEEYTNSNSSYDLTTI